MWCQESEGLKINLFKKELHMYLNDHIVSDQAVVKNIDNALTFHD